MDRTKSEALWTREFLGMSLSNFLIYITQYAMIAALPIVIMTEYGGGDVEAGLAMTFFQIGTVTARPFAGILIDAVNKRHLMIAITVAFFLVMTAFAFAAALSALYGLRLLHGVIFAVATTTAAALVALVLPPTRKGEGIGYFALSTNLAMVVGPMIGLLLMEHSSATTLFVALSILAAISIAAGGGQKLPDEVILPQKKAGRTLSVSTFIERRALAPALIAGILFFAYGSVLTFIPLYTRSLGLSSETSLFYACYAGAILVTRPFIGRIFDRKGPDYTVYPGAAALRGGDVSPRHDHGARRAHHSSASPRRRLRRGHASPPNARRTQCSRRARRCRDCHLLLVARHQRRTRCRRTWRCRRHLWLCVYLQHRRCRCYCNRCALLCSVAKAQ